MDDLVSVVDLAPTISPSSRILKPAVSADPHLLAGWRQLAEFRAGLLTQGTKVLQMQRAAGLADLLADSRRSNRIEKVLPGIEGG